MSARQCYVLILSLFAQGVYGDIEGRIFNGYEVDIHRFQYAAFLHFRMSRPRCCGGSILTANTIITAAYCVEELEYNSGNITVYIGSTIPIEAEIGGVIRRVNNYRIHPKFNPEKGKFNLALLFVSRRIPLGYGYIQRIPISKITPEPGAKLYTCGWGKQVRKKFPDYSDMRHLKASKQRVFPCRKCEKYIGFKMTYGYWCTESVNGDHYHGDAGNGLVSKDNYLVGVVSFIIDKVTIYSDVMRQRRWLADALQSMINDYCYRMTNGK